MGLEPHREEQGRSAEGIPHRELLAGKALGKPYAIVRGGAQHVRNLARDLPNDGAVLRNEKPSGSVPASFCTGQNVEIVESCDRS